MTLIGCHGYGRLSATSNGWPSQSCNESNRLWLFLVLLARATFTTTNEAETNQPKTTITNNAAHPQKTTIPSHVVTTPLNNMKSQITATLCFSSGNHHHHHQQQHRGYQHSQRTILAMVGSGVFGAVLVLCCVNILRVQHHVTNYNPMVRK